LIIISSPSSALAHGLCRLGAWETAWDNAISL